MLLAIGLSALFCSLIWLRGYDPADKYEYIGGKPKFWEKWVGHLTGRYPVAIYKFLIIGLVLIFLQGYSYPATLILSLILPLSYLIGDWIHEKRKVFVAGNGKPKALYEEDDTFVDSILHKIFGLPTIDWSSFKSRMYGSLYGSLSGLIFTVGIIPFSIITGNYLASSLALTGLLYGPSYLVTSVLDEKHQENIARGIWGLLYGLAVGILII